MEVAAEVAAGVAVGIGLGFVPEPRAPLAPAAPGAPRKGALHLSSLSIKRKSVQIGRGRAAVTGRVLCKSQCPASVGWEGAGGKDREPEDEVDGINLGCFRG